MKYTNYTGIEIEFVKILGHGEFVFDIYSRNITYLLFMDNLPIKTNSLDFWEKYKIIGSTKLYNQDVLKAKECRYCLGTTDEVTFLQKTHLLPELVLIGKLSINNK